jgi:hypothetical protein
MKKDAMENKYERKEEKYSKKERKKELSNSTEKSLSWEAK